MEFIDNFFTEFFSGENLAYVSQATKIWSQAAFIFLFRNNEILKMASIFVSIILLAGIIYSFKRGLKEAKNLHDLTFKDFLGLGAKFRPRSLKAWKIILERLENNEPGSWKLAVIEADRLFDHLLRVLGYGGTASEERFQKLLLSQFSDVKSILGAHLTASELLNQPDTEITRENAKEIIEIYKKAFEEIGLIG